MLVKSKGGRVHPGGEKGLWTLFLLSDCWFSGFLFVCCVFVFVCCVFVCVCLFVVPSLSSSFKGPAAGQKGAYYTNAPG